MTRSTYHLWFLATVAFALFGIVTFNALADRFILRHPEGHSLQTISGFERVIKPAWLNSIAPNVVFVGSSRVRYGFDPSLIDRSFAVHSFNYGFSSVSAYETRRFVQDAAAQPSVKLIVLALDPFSDENPARRPGPGFDELRLAVSADGAPTLHRSIWLNATRYLSGGATGMHILGLTVLAQMRQGEAASDRPDLFGAYSVMTLDDFQKDLKYRNTRFMRLSPLGHQELLTTLRSVCNKPVRLIAFFPPDNAAVIARYEANDSAGFFAFKATVLNEVRRHNSVCKRNVSLFDFMQRNVITTSPFIGGKNANYVDLVHFSPYVGVRLFRVMTAPTRDGPDAVLGRDLATVDTGEPLALGLRGSSHMVGALGNTR